MLTFLAKNFKEGNKTNRLLEATLLLAPVELNMVSETDEGLLGAEGMVELGSDVSTVDDKIKSEPTDECTVDLTDLVHVEADASPPSKQPRLGSVEKIIVGKELTDTEINLAQQLLKSQFPGVNGPQSTYCKTSRQCSLKSLSVITFKLFTVKDGHWVVATTMNCDIYVLC